MTGPIRTIWLLLAAAAATACNGSASGAGEAAAAGRAASAANASPGGIWHGLDGGDGSLSLMIAETGELKAFSEGPAFGSGAVVVTGGDRVAGSFDTRALGTRPGEAAGAPGHCELEGSIVERVAMHLEVTCSLADDGAARHESRTLLFDSRYMGGSSPDAIAGNYTLPFNRLANSLTIANDGALFGVYDNGARCTINGTARPVDGRFNLYRFGWQLANCAAPDGRLEGAEFTGLGFRNPPGTAPGTLLLLLTGTVEQRFEFLSLVYEPA